MKVIYKNDRKFYDIEFSAISRNVVQLIGIIPLNTNGFKIIRDDWLMLGDYLDYKTIYKTVSGGYQYSNDGSVYAEPVVVVPEEPEEPEPTIPIPTLQEQINSLAEGVDFLLMEMLPLLMG